MAVHRSFRRAAMLIGLLASTAGPVASTPTARVAVNFVAPERYTDAGDRFGAGPGLRVTLAEIRRIIEGAALRAMAPGDDLRVDVLDIDLAGFAHPGLSPVSAPRVVSDVTPPAFRLRYDLQRGGRRIAGGDERVSDINFLFGAREPVRGLRLRGSAPAGLGQEAPDAAVIGSGESSQIAGKRGAPRIRA